MIKLFEISTGTKAPNVLTEVQDKLAKKNIDFKRKEFDDLDVLQVNKKDEEAAQLILSETLGAKM